MANVGLSDEVIVLLEEVIKSNRALLQQNQAVRSTEQQNRDALREINEKLRDITNERTTEQTTRRRTKRRSGKEDEITVPVSCRRAVRKVYKALEKKDDFPGFYIDESIDSDNNKAVLERVMNEVVHDNGGDRCAWTRAVIEAAFQRYFLSRVETMKMVQNNKYNEHKKRSRQNGRKREKMTRRTLALERCGWETSRKGEAAEMLIPDAMSSEESDCDDDGKVVGYLTKRLPWESAKAKKIKRKLDKIYFQSLSKRARDRVLPRVTGNPSNRDPPNNLPDWAINLGEI